MLYMISLLPSLFRNFWLPLKVQMPNTWTKKEDRQTFAMSYFYRILERNVNEASWLLFNALA